MFLELIYITYQDLGFVKDNYLTVISPTKKIKQYQLIKKESDYLTDEYNIYYTENLFAKIPRKDLEIQAISAYQSTSHWLKERN